MQQVVRNNLSTNPHIQVGPGLKLFQEMNMSKDSMGNTVPLTDTVRPFFLVIP